MKRFLALVVLVPLSIPVLAEDYGVPSTVKVDVSQSYHVDDPSVLGLKTTPDGRPVQAASTVDAGDLQVPLSAAVPTAHVDAPAPAPTLAPLPNMSPTIELSVVKPPPAPAPVPPPVAPSASDIVVSPTMPATPPQLTPPSDVAPAPSQMAIAPARPSAPDIVVSPVEPAPLAPEPAVADQQVGATGLPLQPPPDTAPSVSVSSVRNSAQPSRSSGTPILAGPAPTAVVTSSGSAPAPLPASVRLGPTVVTGMFSVLGVDATVKVEPDVLSTPQPLQAVPKVAKPVRTNFDAREVARQVNYMDSQLITGL